MTTNEPHSPYQENGGTPPQWVLRALEVGRQRAEEGFRHDRESSIFFDNLYMVPPARKSTHWTRFRDGLPLGALVGALSIAGTYVFDVFTHKINQPDLLDRMFTPSQMASPIFFIGSAAVEGITVGGLATIIRFTVGEVRRNKKKKA